MALSLSFSFLIIWGIVGWKVNKELNTVAYEVAYTASVEDEKSGIVSQVDTVTVVRTDNKIEVGSTINILDVDNKGNFRNISDEIAQKTPQRRTRRRPSRIYL